jgi:hypothetical protein
MSSFATTLVLTSPISRGSLSVKVTMSEDFFGHKGANEEVAAGGTGAGVRRTVLIKYAMTAEGKAGKN